MEKCAKLGCTQSANNEDMLKKTAAILNIQVTLTQKKKKENVCT